ncbi:MAG: WYL domain-containing protein [Nitrospirae bacterium]|nr:WYL domain-containing protein [Nitrospirota bacterium]
MDLRNRNLTFFDLETTGLNPWRGDRIVEVGAIRAKGAEVVETFATLVNPMRPIPPEVSKVHGITDGMVAHSPTQDEVLPGFLKFIGEDVLMAHNASFDIGFFSSAMNDLKLGFPDNIVIDTLTLSRKLYPEYERHSMDILRTRFSLPTDFYHRAERDARDLHTIFMNFLGKIEEHGLGTLKDLIDIHGPALTFDPREIEPDIYPPQLYDDLIQATRDQRCVLITYVSGGRGHQSQRVVDPYKIVKLSAHDYLVGYCHLKGTSRNFRLDRITAWKLTSDNFERPADTAPHAVPDPTAHLS